MQCRVRVLGTKSTKCSLRTIRDGLARLLELQCHFKPSYFPASLAGGSWLLCVRVYYEY